MEQRDRRNGDGAVGRPDRGRGDRRLALWFWLAWLAGAAALSVTVFSLRRGYGALYLWGAAGLLFAFRPGSALHRPRVEGNTPGKTLCAVLAASAVIAACVLPMGELPIWNGEEPNHRNQYELMAEAILDGRVEFAYGDEKELERLNNPYDPAERKASGVSFHWDHAYYEGHYYMYFGVVPEFLAFIPYRLITGETLNAYQATQLFTALAAAGIFALFHLLARLFFGKLPFSVYVALATAASAIGLWYGAAEPALYCTAITAALALEIWSLYFFVRAVWGEGRENRQIVLAAAGALLGALTFGCRPSIALANLLVLPMLAAFLRQRKFSWKLLGKLALAALPYAAVAAALMWYNFIRFDDPFEFGQAYQLTVADQSGYRLSLDPATLGRVAEGTAESFFGAVYTQGAFPYLSPGGIFLNFPLLFLGAAALAPSAWRNARRRNALALALALSVTVLVITAVDMMWTPYFLERYHMDVAFLMGTGCFMAVGLWCGAGGRRRREWLSFAVETLSAAAVVGAVLLYAYRVEVFYPERAAAMAKALGLGSTLP